MNYKLSTKHETVVHSVVFPILWIFNHKLLFLSVCVCRCVCVYVCEHVRERENKKERREKSTPYKTEITLNCLSVYFIQIWYKKDLDAGKYSEVSF